MRKVLVKSLILIAVITLLSLQLSLTKAFHMPTTSDSHEIMYSSDSVIPKVIASSSDVLNETNETVNTTLIIKQLSNNITSIEKKVDELSKDISKLEATIGGLDKRIEDVENEIHFVRDIAVISLGLCVVTLLVAITAILIARRPEKQKVAGKIKKRK